MSVLEGLFCDCGAGSNDLRLVSYAESKGGMPETVSILCTKCKKESLRFQFENQAVKWWKVHTSVPKS